MWVFSVVSTRNAFLCAIAVALLFSISPAASAQEAIATPILTTAPNFRDLAGISASNGGTGFSNATSNNGFMRTGVFYRTDALDRLNNADWTTISSLRIGRDIDLRTPSEMASNPDLVPRGATFTNINIYGAYAPTPSPFSGAPANAVSFMRQGYQAFVTDQVQRNAFHTVLITLATDSTPDVYHCSGGKDRTGWTSTILQTIAGVPQATIMRDYLATNTYTASLMATTKAQFLAENRGWDGATIDALLGVEASYLQAGLDQVAATYGSWNAYLTQGGTLFQHLG